jgi:hypothetical protein
MLVADAASIGVLSAHPWNATASAAGLDISSLAAASADPLVSRYT